MSKRNLGISLAAVPAAALVLLVAAWAIDGATSRNEVHRNVRIAGQNVGGMQAARLDEVMSSIDERLTAIPVEITVGEDTLSSTLGAFAVALDREATSAAAFDARDGGFVLFGPFRWLGSFFNRSDAPVSLMIDEAAARSAAEQLGKAVEAPAVEPSLSFRNGELQAVPGRDGSRLDVDSVVAALAALNGDRLDGDTIEIAGALVEVPPKQSDDSAGALRDRVEEQLERPIEVRFGDEERTLDPTQLAPFITAQLTDDDELVVDLEDAPTLAYLGKAFADVGTPPTEPDVSVSGGKVVVGGGKAGTVCCGPDAVDSLARALEQGDDTVSLSLAPKSPERDQKYYERLGIVEQVASFTTEHPCCAPRVDNIHRMADIVGAHVLAPGETFSLNDVVGRRTVANGFFPAPVINGDGNFDEDVGGGVSQFSTTLFNAAFFAGLEIDEYMAHGLYISRYPYGREATLSFPSPDLKVRNITPYGVLIWPTYTDTSITVSMYSTRYIDAEQSGQFESVYGTVCTQVTTLRERTWIDTGRTETDRFYALYAPAEGVQCDGTTRPKPGETTTTSSSTIPGTPPSSGSTVPGDPGSTTTSGPPGGSTTTAPPGATTSTTTSTSTTAATTTTTSG